MKPEKKKKSAKEKAVSVSNTSIVKPKMIERWAKKNGLRKEEIALRLRLSMSTINKIFTGKPISYPIVIALSHITGVKESRLISKEAQV